MFSVSLCETVKPQGPRTADLALSWWEKKKLDAARWNLASSLTDSLSQVKQKGKACSNLPSFPNIHVYSPKSTKWVHKLLQVPLLEEVEQVHASLRSLAKGGFVAPWSQVSRHAFATHDITWIVLQLQSMDVELHRILRNQKASWKLPATSWAAESYWYVNWWSAWMVHESWLNTRALPRFCRANFKCVQHLGSNWLYQHQHFLPGRGSMHLCLHDEFVTSCNSSKNCLHRGESYKTCDFLFLERSSTISPDCPWHLPLVSIFKSHSRSFWAPKKTRGA